MRMEFIFQGIGHMHRGQRAELFVNGPPGLVMQRQHLEQVQGHAPKPEQVGADLAVRRAKNLLLDVAEW